MAMDLIIAFCIVYVGLVIYFAGLDTTLLLFAVYGAAAFGGFVGSLLDDNPLIIGMWGAGMSLSAISALVLMSSNKTDAI